MEGRATDFVVAADGTIMHGLALIYIIREMQGIEAFKIIQKTLLHTQVYLQPSAELTLAMQQHIEQGFKQRLGENVQIELIEVDVSQC